MQNRDFGVWAEEQAASYLERILGWRILARRVNFREGEIDLIAEDESGLKFVEVKGRRGDEFGAVVEALTSKKWTRLRRAVYRWREREKDFRPGEFIFVGILKTEAGFELELLRLE